MTRRDREIKAEYERRRRRGMKRTQAAIAAALGTDQAFVAKRIGAMKARGEWEYETRRGAASEEDVARVYARLLGSGVLARPQRVAAEVGMPRETVTSIMGRLRSRGGFRAPRAPGGPDAYPAGVREAVADALAAGMTPAEVVEEVEVPEGFELTTEKVRALALCLELPCVDDPTPEEIAERARAIRMENLAAYRRSPMKDRCEGTPREKRAYRDPMLDAG